MNKKSYDKETIGVIKKYYVKLETAEKVYKIKQDKFIKSQEMM